MAFEYLQIISNIFFTTALQLFIYIDEIPLSAVSSEQSHLSWPFLIGEMVYSLSHLPGPLLDTVQQL